MRLDRLSTRLAESPVTLVVVVVAVAAVGVRAVLYRELPALLTYDSWDYLQSAGEIRREGDFFGQSLRDVRLPGYSVLLALTFPLTHLGSDAIVLLQAALGLVTVALGWTIGALLGSRLVSLAMAAVLGLSPVYLLSEHAVMCETLGLLLYVALVAVGIASLRPDAGWRSSALLGLVLGIATVTRANVLALGATMAFAACVVRVPPGGLAIRRLGPALVTAAVALAVVTPWLWRNWTAYGRPVIFASTNRNVVMYKNMHDPLDPSTPTLAALNQKLGHPVVDYDWLRKLTLTHSSNDGEALAGAILAEDIAKHPWRHVRQIAETVAGFLGFKPYVVNERNGTLFLFRVYVADVSLLNGLALESPSGPLTRDWVYVPRAGDTWATRLFARIGSLYLMPGRAIMNVVFLATAGACVAGLIRRRGWREERGRLVLVLLVGWLGTVAMHAMALSDYDRYAAMFDFLVVLIVAVIADDALRRRRLQGA